MRMSSSSYNDISSSSFGDNNRFNATGAAAIIGSDDEFFEHRQHLDEATIAELLAHNTSLLFGSNESVTEDYHWCSKPRQHFKSLAEVVLILSVGSACDLLIIVSHIIVLLAFALNATYIFSQPGHYYLLYLVNLSVCDLAIGLVSVPSRLLMDLRGCWPMGNFLCTVYQVVSWLALNGRALTYCCIAYDRYLMIAQGLAYSIKCTKRRILIRIAALWVFTILIYVPPHFYDVIFRTGSTRWPGQCLPEFTVDIYLFNTLIIFSNFFSPLLLAMLYVMVWMALRQRTRAAQILKKDFTTTHPALRSPATPVHNYNINNNNNNNNSDKRTDSLVQHDVAFTAVPETIGVMQHQHNNQHHHQPLLSSHSTTSSSGGGVSNFYRASDNELSADIDASEPATPTRRASRRQGSPAIVHVPLMPIQVRPNQGAATTTTTTTRTSMAHITATSNTTHQHQLSPSGGNNANHHNLIILTPKDKRAARRARRATRSMMLLTSTFLVCQLPFGLTTLTLVMCPNDWCKTSGHFIWRLLVITQYVLFFNSLLNPLLYGIAFPAVRTAIEALLPKSLVTCMRYCLSMCVCQRKKSSSSEMRGGGGMEGSRRPTEAGFATTVQPAPVTTIDYHADGFAC